MVYVTFSYHTGMTRSICSNARLTGSWDAAGRFSDHWSTVPMRAVSDDAGCCAFTAEVQFDDSQIGRTFHWGVFFDACGKADTWGIVTEVGDMDSAERSRSFVLGAGGQNEHYWLTTARRFGAQKSYSAAANSPAIRFSVWAPKAKKVEVVFAQAEAKELSSGYIDDDGNGIDATLGEDGAFPLFAQGDGTFSTDLRASPDLSDYAIFLQRLYMFRITNEQGERRYKIDLWSRDQIGGGAINPHGRAYTGSFQDLDGSVGCSVVTDPDLVAKSFEDAKWPKGELISASEFWKDEFTPGFPLPQRVDDLSVYELHVSSFAPGANDADGFAGRIVLLDRLVDLGVNAVELLPVAGLSADLQWGLGSTRFFCVQTSAGAGDELKFFIRACHQRGIVVILHVVYGYLSKDGERAEWGYDSDPSVRPEHNIYYWYEGRSRDYISGEDGYVENGSGGWTPRLWEETVRQMFTSSAAMMIDEYHVDGIKVGFADALCENNCLHGDGRPLGNVNRFGVKLLRELTRTARLVRPGIFLIAEDNRRSGMMTRPADEGGVGFDALWYAGLYWDQAGRFEGAEPAFAESTPATVEVPGQVFRRMQAYCVANGLDLDEAVTKALEAFMGNRA